MIEDRNIAVRRGLAAALSVLCAVPFGYLIALSVSDRWVFPGLRPTSLSARHWAQILSGSSDLASSFVVSVTISLVVAALSTPAGYLTGKAISRHRHSGRLLLLAYVPFIMSPVILGVCLMYLYLKAGVAGTVYGVILAQLIFAFGFSIVFFSGFWNSRINALEDLVLTLGGSPWQAFTHALLPVSKGMLILCFFQTFLISWFQYGLTLLVASGQVRTLPILVFDYINEANFYLAAVASCLLVLPPALLLWVNKRILYKPI